MTKFMRVAVGGGYRLALSDTMNKGLASSDLSGFLARANLEFGPVLGKTNERFDEHLGEARCG